MQRQQRGARSPGAPALGLPNTFARGTEGRGEGSGSLRQRLVSLNKKSSHRETYVV